MECSPREIDEKVIEFCKIINAEAEAHRIPVNPEKSSRENYCYDNVSLVTDKLGGKSLGGWIIWRRDNMYLEAEAHAIWETNRGELVDVTPHTPPEKHIIFLRDDRVEYSGERIANRFFPLTESELVRDYIGCCERLQQLEDENRDMNGNVVLSGENRNEYMEKKNSQEKMDSILDAKAERNEPCPCGSGIKYKRCCGQYR